MTVIYWVDASGPRHNWRSIRPWQSRPGAGTTVLVERDVNLNSLEARLLAQQNRDGWIRGSCWFTLQTGRWMYNPLK